MESNLRLPVATPRYFKTLLLTYGVPIRVSEPVLTKHLRDPGFTKSNVGVHVQRPGAFPEARVQCTPTLTPREAFPAPALQTRKARL